MPRNPSGTYSLPAGNPVTTGTTITSTWANTTLGDIGTELTWSLDRNGTGGMLQPLALPNGSAPLPALTFSAETSSGLFRNGAQDLEMSINGGVRQKWLDSGVVVQGAGAGAGLTAVGGTTSGAGINATGGAPNGNAIIALGTGAGAAVMATGGATSGAGLVATGGLPNGNGLTATGQGGGAAVVGTGGQGSGGFFTGGLPNGTGVKGFGQGTAPGGDFLGGATGHGVLGTGGGAPGANGVRGVGGSNNGTGVVGLGINFGVGGLFKGGGPGNADGVQCEGNHGITATGIQNEGVLCSGAPNMPGLRADPGAGGTTAIDSHGNISFSQAPTGSSTPVDRQLGPSNLLRAWCKCTYVGNIDPAVSASFNVSGVKYDGLPGAYYVDLVFTLPGDVIALFCDWGTGAVTPVRTTESLQSVVGGKSRISFQTLNSSGVRTGPAIGVGFSLFVTGL